MALPSRRHQHAPTWWDPVAEFEDLYARMGQLFTWAFSDRARTRLPAWLPVWSPATDLTETGEAYLIDVNLPGLREHEISIEIEGEDLVITGEFPALRHDGTLRRQARPVGRFECRTTLPGPFDAEKVNARLADGVLTVRLPKTGAAGRRQVPVSTD